MRIGFGLSIRWSGRWLSRGGGGREEVEVGVGGEEGWMDGSNRQGEEGEEEDEWDRSE